MMGTLTALTEAHELIEEMYKKGSLDSYEYNTCLVALAGDYMCDHNDIETALKLLNRCEVEFFQGPIVKAMETDSFFEAVVVELTYKIIQLGLLSDIQSEYPTQKIAMA